MTLHVPQKEPPVLPLRLEAVTFDAGGRRLLGPITLELRQGLRTVVLGPNGAGKTLALRLCHGLLAPGSGRVRWAGEPAARPVGDPAQAMAFQRPVLLRRSARANVEYALFLRGMPRSQRREVAQQALEKVGLARLAASPARVLSAGEQQRLALARAWAVRPQVLFLDEPAANLDPAATHQIEALLNEFHAEGTKIVMSTHDLAQCRRLADEIVFLHRGLMLEHSEAGRFFKKPATTEAQGFLRGELVW